MLKKQQIKDFLKCVPQKIGKLTFNFKSNTYFVHYEFKDEKGSFTEEGLKLFLNNNYENLKYFDLFEVRMSEGVVSVESERLLKLVRGYD